MERIKSALLNIASLMAIPFIWLLLMAAEIYMDLTNIKGKGQNGKDDKRN